MRIKIIPENSQEIRRAGIDAVVYVGPGLRTKAYVGKSCNAKLFYRYQSEAQMNEKIEEFFKNLENIAKYKADRKAAKKDYQTELKKDDILYSSWGYEQTNIDYYQVIEVSPTKKSVKLCKLKSKEFSDGALSMTGKSTPLVGEFDGEAFTKKVQPKDWVNLTSYSAAWKWDGRPMSYSNYA